MAEAYRKTCLGKRDTFSFLEFKEYAELNLTRLREQIADGCYIQSPFREFWVFEPKPRLITALTFADRVAQHALMNVPIS